jgi:hypothetical protein
MKPKRAEFAIALRALGKARGRVPRILRAHYEAPGRVATMSYLKKHVGYKSWRGVNLQYGLFADSVAKEIGCTPPETRIFLLVEFVEKKTQSNEHWQLVMRPEFASALKDAGWV